MNLLDSLWNCLQLFQLIAHIIDLIVLVNQTLSNKACPILLKAYGLICITQLYQMSKV